MKQLSALGVRRQFYRNPRRLRALRPGDELDAADLLAQHAPFNYFVGMYVAATHASTTGVNPAGDAGDTPPKYFGWGTQTRLTAPCPGLPR